SRFADKHRRSLPTLDRIIEGQICGAVGRDRDALILVAASGSARHFHCGRKRPPTIGRGCNPNRRVRAVTVKLCPGYVDRAVRCNGHRLVISKLAGGTLRNAVPLKYCDLRERLITVPAQPGFSSIT